MTATATQPRSSTSLGIEPGRSWLSLLASSSLGVERLATVEVEVVLGASRLGQGPFRLIVQTFGGKNDPRPIGCSQRMVTAADLKRGVRLSLIELGSNGSDEPYVVAWVEAGDRALELDGRRARPGQGSLVAMTRATRGKNPIRLTLG